jgi:hypothetical protein
MREPPEPDVATLRGETSKGYSVTLTVVDGQVRSLMTTASVYCRYDRTWYPIHWTAAKGAVGRFYQEDESFRVHQRKTWEPPDTPTPQITVTTMRGRLTDDRASARGTIDGHWASGEYACTATVRFRARDVSPE